MSDLSLHSYQEIRDTFHEIGRYYGFFRKERAAEAKAEIAQGLTALIQAAKGTFEGTVRAASSRWWYNTDSLAAFVDGRELEIFLGAKHQGRATNRLPCAGIFSELAVNIFTYGNVIKFIESSLAKEMKRYLDKYGNGI